MADNQNEKSRELSVKVDVDVADALTGLKAIQREAKKATQALRELEAAHSQSKPVFDMSAVLRLQGVVKADE